MDGLGDQEGFETLDPALAKAVSPDASWGLSQGGGIYQDSQNTQLSPLATTTAGLNQPHNNMQPYLTLNFCIVHTRIGRRIDDK